MTLALSVVIPSHNRAQKLDALLAALAAQDTDQPFEVIVVLDGCTDASRHIAELWEELGAFAAFRWIEQPRKGQATARNVGAFVAEAPVVLFIDDDVVPDPNLISVHLQHHASGESIAVLGDCEIVLSDQPSFLRRTQWAWWEDTYFRRAADWQPSSYRDFLTGNVSLRREDFARVGGFDDGFTSYGAEDYELGYRLLRYGVRFVADRRAYARHFNTATVRRMVSASRQSGRGDVLIARKHPAIVAGLPLAGSGGPRLRIAAGMAMYLPWLGTLVCLAKRGMMRLWEFFGLRGRWLRDYAFVTWFGYWRGLHDATGSMKELRRIRALAPPVLEQEIDIAEDLGPQVQTMIVDVPSTIHVLHRGDVIGSMSLRAHIEEPLMAWVAREVPRQLSEQLFAEIAHDALPIIAALEDARGILEAG